MGKYNNMMKCAQVRSLVSEKQYQKALDIIEDLNIEQINTITDLNVIAEVFKKFERYEDAREIYLRLYDRIQTRRVIYQLIYLSVKCNNIEDAEEFYKEYLELDDKSSDRLVLRYYINKAKGVERKVLIQCLEELKHEDYMEDWAYELAKLYHKEGMEEECVRECSDIILWFGEGMIVEKAMLLKLHYVDGADISTTKAIEQTRNMAAELKMAAMIAEQNEKKKMEEELRRQEVYKEIHSKREEKQELANESVEENEVEEEQQVPLEETRKIGNLTDYIKKKRQAIRSESSESSETMEVNEVRNDNLENVVNFESKQEEETVFQESEQVEQLESNTEEVLTEEEIEERQEKRYKEELLTFQEKLNTLREEQDSEDYDPEDYLEDPPEPDDEYEEEFQEIANSTTEIPVEEIRNAMNELPVEEIKNDINEFPVEQVEHAIHDTLEEEMEHSVKDTLTEEVNVSMKEITKPTNDSFGDVEEIEPKKESDDDGVQAEKLKEFIRDVQAEKLEAFVKNARKESLEQEQQAEHESKQEVTEDVKQAEEKSKEESEAVWLAEFKESLINEMEAGQEDSNKEKVSSNKTAISTENSVEESKEESKEDTEAMWLSEFKDSIMSEIEEEEAKISAKKAEEKKKEKEIEKEPTVRNKWLDEFKEDTEDVWLAAFRKSRNDIQEELDEEESDFYFNNTKTEEPLEQTGQPIVVKDQAEHEEPDMETTMEESEEDVTETMLSMIETSKEEGKTPHFALLGMDKEKIADFARVIGKELNNQGMLDTFKVAKTTAESLNKINLEERRRDVAGTCLLIENANQLSLESMISLYQLLGQNKCEFSVILSDTEENIKSLMTRNRKLNTIVTNQLKL